MKRQILPVFIGIAVLVAVGTIVSYNLFKRQRQFLKIEIPSSYLQTVDSSRYSVQPIIVTRSKSDDSVLVFFPRQEGASQVFLYDQLNYNRLLFGDHHGTPLFIPDDEGLKAIFERPVINFSDFPQGKYYVHISGCDFGGFLQLDISDSTE